VLLKEGLMGSASGMVVAQATPADYALIRSMQAMIVGHDHSADHLRDPIAHEHCWLGRFEIHPVGFVVFNAGSSAMDL